MSLLLQERKNTRKKKKTVFALLSVIWPLSVRTASGWARAQRGCRRQWTVLDFSVPSSVVFCLACGILLQQPEEANTARGLWKPDLGVGIIYPLVRVPETLASPLTDKAGLQTQVFLASEKATPFPKKILKFTGAEGIILVRLRDMVSSPQ